MHTLDLKALKRKNMAALSHVQLGALYQHKKSSKYYIAKLVSLREEDLEPLVTYSPLSHNDVAFTRPLEEFKERFVKMPARAGLL